MSWLLIILLVLLLIGVMPRWGYSRNWGYGPTGLATGVLVVLVILILTRTIHI